MFTLKNWFQKELIMRDFNPSIFKTIHVFRLGYQDVFQKECSIQTIFRKFNLARITSYPWIAIFGDEGMATGGYMYCIAGTIPPWRHDRS